MHIKQRVTGRFISNHLLITTKIKRVTYTKENYYHPSIYIKNPNDVENFLPMTAIEDGKALYTTVIFF